MQGYIKSKIAAETPEATLQRWQNEAEAYLEDIKKKSSSHVQNVITQKLPSGTGYTIPSQSSPKT